MCDMVPMMHYMSNVRSCLHRHSVIYNTGLASSSLVNGKCVMAKLGGKDKSCHKMIDVDEN